jgi:mono/diheme cytochrome c family protein
VNTTRAFPRIPTLLSVVALAIMTLGALTIMTGESRAATPSRDGASIERGRYLAKIAGCNDCHTPGYAQSAGKVSEAQWLTGDALGWAGPWGTTYPANLRLALQNVSEADWIKRARTTELRPPMPWFALRDMSDNDLRAIYRYVQHLGPAGKPAPAYVPPGQRAAGPVVQFPAAP